MGIFRNGRRRVLQFQRRQGSRRVILSLSDWYKISVRPIGLCFGGGQIGVGVVGTMLGMLILIGLKIVEDQMKQDHQGKLEVLSGVGGPDENEIRTLIRNDGFHLSSCAFAAADALAEFELICELHWRAKSSESKVPKTVYRLAARTGVIRVAWTPEAR